MKAPGSTLSRLFFVLFTALFLGACSGTKPVDPGTNPTDPGLPPQPPVPGPSTVVIGTFSSARAGTMAFSNSSSFNQARASIRANYPQARMLDFSILSASAVQDAHILILHVLASNLDPIQPLSGAEQQALRDFVNRGGGVLLMTDHIDFAAANASFLMPYNMDARGLAKNIVTASVPNPRLSPVTNGPFGSVSSFTQNWASGFVQVAANAVRLAANPVGDALVAFPPGSISPSSGAVVIFSDASTFVDDKATGLFPQNEVLFLNAFDYLVRGIMQ